MIYPSKDREWLNSFTNGRYCRVVFANDSGTAMAADFDSIYFWFLFRFSDRE